jgi:hypothetical protein
MVPVSQSGRPAGGHESTVHPVPDSPPVAKQFEKPEKLFRLNSPEPARLSMLPPGRFARTEHSLVCVNCTVPLGQSAGSKEPPVLLLMLNVKACVAHRQTPPEQVLMQSALMLQPWPSEQSAGQLPPQSMSVSLPFCTPSVQVAA